MSVNRIQLQGYIGTEPVFDQTRSGVSYMRFRLSSKTQKKGESHTSWFNVIAWDRRVEWFGHMKKGDYVYVEGQVTVDEFVDKSGKERTSVEINLQDAHVVAPKGRAPSSPSDNRQRPQAQWDEEGQDDGGW